MSGPVVSGVAPAFAMRATIARANASPRALSSKATSFFDSPIRFASAPRGFDVASVLSVREGHFGLTGMRERVKWLGGDIHLESSPGAGAEVRVEIPYDASVREAAVPAAPVNGGG